MASSAPAARFAEGEDPQQLGPDTELLQQQGWALDGNGMGVTKTFHFKSYFKAVVCAYGDPSYSCRRKAALPLSLSLPI
jgi:hypothetical protein